MEKISNESKKESVQSHIEKGYALMKEFLPPVYLPKVKEKLAGKGISDSTIKNVRRNQQSPLANMEVFIALVEVAQENKAHLESLEKLVNQ